MLKDPRVLSILPDLLLQKCLQPLHEDVRNPDLGTAARKNLQTGSGTGDSETSDTLHSTSRSDVVEVASRRWSAANDTDCDSGNSESRSRSRRLQLLREQLRRENRRSADPFSHPLANHGPLSRLRDQIRDVSRIADAVATSADSAPESRQLELCADLRRLLQTQQRWTERLENQIWRLESQARLMKRLQQCLMHGSPGTDHLRELCELIARETQAIPEGLLLLPEPGHRVVLPSEEGVRFAARAIEHARFSVFAAMSLLPDVRGADLVACSLRANLMDPASFLLAEKLVRLAPDPVIHPETDRLLVRIVAFIDAVDELSVSAGDRVVPPDLKGFYGRLLTSWPSQYTTDESVESGPSSASSLCKAMGLARSEIRSAGSSDLHRAEHLPDYDADERIVLTHKLRWHSGTTGPDPSETKSMAGGGSSTVPGPKFLRRSVNSPKFTVFVE